MTSLNFRRFFEITTLAGVRIERPEAFEKVHAKSRWRFTRKVLIDGVRVDHVDGLTDPGGLLRAAAARRSKRKRAERPEGRRG